MNDHEALLRAIIADRADDSVRLAFADFLEERGDVRAEFIRCQIELARCKHGPTICRVRDPNDKPVLPETTCDFCGLNSPLRQREKELEFLNWRKWGLHAILSEGIAVTDPPCHPPSFGEGKWENFAQKFTRGFVSEIGCSWESWSKHHADIMRQTPLEKVNLTSRPPGMSLLPSLLRDALTVAFEFERQWPTIKFSYALPEYRASS